jgi:hypothetical protein
MFYALWDLESGNQLGDFDTEHEALVVVRDLLDANEPDYAEMLSLGRTGDDGSTVIVADGKALAARARDDLDPSRRTV